MKKRWKLHLSLLWEESLQLIPEMARGFRCFKYREERLVNKIRSSNKKVWDIFIRIFHWSLLFFVVSNFYTGKWGDGSSSMEWHSRFGISVLGLIVFRFLWGVWGSPTAKFTHFIPSPKTLLLYRRTFFKREPSYWYGHTPPAALGALSLLLCILLQAVTGLFATDEIITEGPLCKMVDDQTCLLMSEIHFINSKFMLVLIGLHFGAVIYYLLYKKENLIKAMISGRKDQVLMDENELLKENQKVFGKGIATAALSVLIVWFILSQ